MYIEGWPTLTLTPSNTLQSNCVLLRPLRHFLSLSVAEQHTESPEEPRLQNVEEDAEVTIIFNPHSFSSNSSQSPQPSTPATGAAAEITTSSSPNRRSGSGFDYKDDPVGDKAYLAAQYYIEQPLGSSPPSSSVASGRSGSGGSEDAGLSSGSGAPPLPPRVLLKPSHLPRTGGSGTEQKSSKGGGPKKQTGGSWKPERRQRERKESEEEDDEDGMKRRASEYLQAAQEEGEKRQVCETQLVHTCVFMFSSFLSSRS